MSTRAFFASWMRWLLPTTCLAVWLGAFFGGLALLFTGKPVLGAVIMLVSSAIFGAGLIAWMEVRNGR